MNLGIEQAACQIDYAKLVLKAKELGIDIRPGEGPRTPLQMWANSLPSKTTIIGQTIDGKEVHFWDSVGGIGISQSKHGDKLAWDIFIVKADKISNSVEDYRPLGEFWKSLDSKNRWGGEFTTRVDPYHFERFV